MRFKKLLSVIGIAFVTVVLLSVLGLSVYACTNVPVGKDASVDGSVITTHTCDGWYDNRIVIVPGKTFEKGTMTPVYKELCHLTRPGVKPVKTGEIPQVEKTYTYFRVGYPFMNEHQVMIGESTFGGRFWSGEGILMIEQLEALGLQRAKTAREAIKVMGALAEKYGYGDCGEALTVADSNEVWIFEIISAGPTWAPESGKPGAAWAAQRIPDDHASVIANRSRIGEINLEDPDHFMASENVFSFAKEMDWWDPEDGPFVFWKAYCPEPYGWPFYQRRREWRALSLLAPSLNLDPEAEHYPFSVKPDKKVSVQDIMAIKRDYLKGTKFDLTKGLAAGPFGNPNRYPTPSKVKPEGRKDLDWERALSMFRCSYSFVSQARSWLPDPIGGVLWFGEDAPHSTCYIPFYCGITKVPKSFSSGRRDVFDKDSAWWAFNFVSNWADLKFSYMIKDIKAAQNELEGDFFAMQPAIEKAALEMYKKDPSLAVKFLTDYSNNCANRAVDTWWKLAKKLIAKYDDGYVNGESVGYPTWWLKAVDFGGTIGK
ncbi:MAG: C69 family dipeptidase [Candidatus Aerophobetes bacterium]|nr:C69 family dipeptidase [Candidatus Aerophobetes bacterium]